MAPSSGVATSARVPGCQPMPSILQKQMALVDEFTADPDWQARYARIIARARSLLPLPEVHRIEANKVRGCSSTVWLAAERDGPLLRFHADSDAILVRGLVALLVEVYSGHEPREILGAEPAFIEELGLNVHLSPNRANGLGAMVRQIKANAAMPA
jgi:cysteine desulfuration protein SufE